MKIFCFRINFFLTHMLREAIPVLNKEKSKYENELFYLLKTLFNAQLYSISAFENNSVSENKINFIAKVYTPKPLHHFAKI